MVTTNLDGYVAGELIDVFRAPIGCHFRIISVWAATREGLESFHAATYHLLGAIPAEHEAPGVRASRTGSFTLPIESIRAWLRGETSAKSAISSSPVREGSGVFDGRVVTRGHGLNKGGSVKLPGFPGGMVS